MQTIEQKNTIKCKHRNTHTLKHEPNFSHSRKNTPFITKEATQKQIKTHLQVQPQANRRKHKGHSKKWKFLELANKHVHKDAQKHKNRNVP